ncbi:MAG: putative peptide maturation dehydrogenase [Acidobacteriota bacterium]
MPSELPPSSPSRFRRAKNLVFSLEDEELVDIEKLLRGEIATRKGSVIKARSARGAKLVQLTPQQFAFLGRLSADDPTAVTDTDLALVEPLLQAGLIVAVDDGPDEDAEISRAGWHPAAAVFHATMRAEARSPKARIDFHGLVADLDSMFTKLVAQHGEPPPAFYERDDRQQRIPLPSEHADSSLSSLLSRRTTVRDFDRTRAMTLEQLATLVHQVWGCHGVSRFADVTLLRRTSPSGGSLHSVEVYPVVLRVAGLASGIYHYNAERHALDQLKTVNREDLEQLVSEVGVGQHWMADASVVFVMTARFPRSYWKYPKSARAFGVVLMDVGHLGQTFYLSATEQGFGAFFSAAIDPRRLDVELDLDGFSEGPIAVCGAGFPATEQPLAKPYVSFDRSS